MQVKKPGDFVRMTHDLKQKMVANGCGQHIDEFGHCHGIVQPVDDESKLPDDYAADVRWQPSKLRYGYHLSNLEKIMKPEITFDDFAKLDIRSGTITKCETIPKSKKLLKLEVFFGPEIGHRTILAGIAGSFDADGLVGTRVAAIVNLAPREMMGMTSHGMLMAGQSASGFLRLVQCDSVEDGTELG